MAMKAVLENLDDLDESLHEHYKLDEKTKKYVLDITDFDSAPRVRALKEEAGQHRIKAREVKTQLDTYAALGTLEEVQQRLDEVETLREAANGKLDPAKIDALVDAKLKTKIAPVERERDQFKTKVAELETVVNDFKQKDAYRTVSDHVREAIKKSAGFVGSAEDDALVFAERHLARNEDGEVVTKDGIAGVTPGVSAAVWLQEMQSKKPHWWGATGGGGALGNKGGGGAGGKNPFTFENWNVTEQGQLVNSDRKKAEQLAKSAGTTIGGRKPAPKK